MVRGPTRGGRKGAQTDRRANSDTSEGLGYVAIVQRQNPSARDVCRRYPVRQPAASARYCRCVGKGRDVLDRYGIQPELGLGSRPTNLGASVAARKRLPVCIRPSPRPRRPAPDDAILIRQTVTVRSPEIDHPRRVAERRDRGRRHVAPGLRSGPRCSRGRTAGSPFPGTRVLSDVPLPEPTCPRRQCNRPAPSVGADTPDKRSRVR
jgi:hypothetical protein